MMLKEAKAMLDVFKGRKSKSGQVEWAHKDSNLELPGYEPGALTIEL